LDALLDAIGIRRKRFVRILASTACGGLLLANLALSYINFGFFRF